MFNIQKLSQEALRFARQPDIIANAFLTFKTSIGVLIGYDEVRNPIFADGEDETIECHLRRTTSDLFINNQTNKVGVDQISNYYIGRLVTPKIYKFPIVSDGEITVVVDGRKGRFIELFEIETSFSREAEIPSNLGQRIQCNIEFFDNA